MLEFGLAAGPIRIVLGRPDPGGWGPVHCTRHPLRSACYRGIWGKKVDRPTRLRLEGGARSGVAPSELAPVPLHGVGVETLAQPGTS